MTKLRKTLSLLVALCMLFSVFAGFQITVSAAEVEVSIVSFLRGEQDDLRSSELLEARVTGYDGNVRDLTYEWTNGIGTYLYVYNDHNMYGINATAGEIEIYNDDVNASSNMSGRAYDTKFSGKGFAWAAIYGANYSNDDLLGTITVRVYDTDGKLLATDSHTGTRSGFWGRYTYNGIIVDSLDDDLQAITFGIFEGDSKLVRELFSEASIVHITCVQSSVDEAEVTAGDNFISLTNNGDGTYSVNALKNNAEGEKITIEMSITKDNCKFHQYSDGVTTTTVHVYERPVPVPTTTTISLTANSIDPRCTYYIGGVEGKKMPDGTILFEGLTPNTTYTIEAQGHVEGTEVVYAYVPCTTLPVHVAQVVVYLDGYYDTTTATAYGTLVDISSVSDDDDDLYLKAIGGREFVELERVEKGIYRVGIENGTYNIYHEKDDATIIGNQQLTMESADRTRYLFYYSVSYDAMGGEGAPETAYYYEGDRAYVSGKVPTYDNYIFAGWEDEEGNIYQPGQLITADIEKPYKLTAIWEETVDLYVNVTLLHQDVGGTEINQSAEKHNITFTVDGRAEMSDYTELSDKTIEWDGVSAFDFDGYEAQYDSDGEATVYTATAPTFTGLPKNMEYTFTSAKTGYELVEIEQETDENGDVVINATLQYDVNNFDFVFEVELDEEAKALHDELKPVAADVKVTAWYDSPYVDGEDIDWYPVMQHHETYVKVTLDETGYGVGTFPVWATNLNEDINYYYRIEVVSFVLPDGSVMTANDIDNAHEVYTTDDKRYSATIEVTNGEAPAGSSLAGAWYDDEQNGNVKAIISIEVFDVTFDPNGGVFADGTSDNKVAEDQIAIPSFEDYTVTRDGNYTFAGWYYADENGNITDEQAAEGTVLLKDETLIAKWNAPRRIEGTVTVEGAYELGGNIHIIHDADRIYSATVLLQRLDANGYAVTIDANTIEIAYDENIGTGIYAFDAVPADGHIYRIYVAGANHKRLFQNEDSESVVVTDYDSYDETHYYSAWGDDEVAMINALLQFNPNVFDLLYEIDATSIGEGFRPGDVDILVLYDDGLKGRNPQNWAVVSQMVHGDEVVGQNTTLVNGAGEDTYSVWQGTSDGSKFYDYAIRVTDVDGVEFNAQAAPFMIYYNGSARYSALTGQTQTLLAQIVPKMYTITFDLNAGEDTITGMDDYYTYGGACQDTYYWSYGTTITAKPVRDNHVFLGWFDEDGNPVTAVDASMHENITVIAKWEALEVYENNYAYIFGYNDSIMGAEGPLLRSELSAMVHRLVKQNGKLGGFVYNAAEPSFNDIAGQWFQSGIEFMHYKGAFDVEEGGSVQPYVAVTRGEAFKFICLGLGFVTDTTLTHQEYANFLYNAGYIQGDGSGDLKVADQITRAEFCTMYNRIIGRANAILTDAEGNEITAETYGFTDMTDRSVWYYNDMIRATSAYDQNGYVSIPLRGIRNVLDDYAG